MTISVVDLFCGCGGYSLGFIQAGCKILLAVDIDPYTLKTYNQNNSGIPILNTDIRNLHSQQILEKIKIKPDIIIASPPCESYTNANRYRKKDPFMRLYDDPMGRLVLHAIRLISDLEPKAFIIENVPQVADGVLKECLIREFERVGISQVYFNRFRTEDYGTPSKRARLFISNVKIRMKKQSRVKDLKLMDMIGDLPPPNSIHDFKNHELTQISKKRNKKIQRLRRGSSLIYYRSARNKMNTNWKKLQGNQVCPTIIGHSRYVHPTEKRLLTVREHARLMGYPDDYEFAGGTSNQYNQIGESVPVPLSNAIAKFCLNNLF